MVAAEQARRQAPDFRPGDTLRVHIKVVEGDSERIQVFEGTCLGRRGHGDGASFTVRKVSFGVGVERTFPLNSPHIEKIEVVKSGRVRRAKLYYLRELTGRAARLAEAESPEAAGEAPMPTEPAKPAPAAPPHAAEKAAPSAPVVQARDESGKGQASACGPAGGLAMKAGTSAK